MQSPRKLAGKGLEGLECARNSSYLNSVGLGLQRGLFWAPETWVRIFGPVLVTLIGTIVSAVGFILGALCILTFGTLLWLIGQIVVVIVGFTGLLRPISRAHNDQSVVSDHARR